MQYEDDDFESALETLSKTTEAQGGEHPNPLLAQSFLLLAKIEKKRGNTEAARTWAKKSQGTGLDFMPAKAFLRSL